MDQITHIHQQISPLRKQLLEHPVYKQIDSLPRLHVFMEYHLFAVWDFMSLLKALQQQLTCVQVPWMPPANPLASQLINEIVLGEESDTDMAGKPASHYELYLQAMEAAGANPQPVQSFLAEVQLKGINEALQNRQLPEPILQFLQFTFNVIATGESHKIAAVFTFGREDLIPDMFTALVKDLGQEFPERLETFVYYLQRHIELDSEEHGPKAMEMIKALCENDSQKWEECVSFAKKALEHRLSLWNGIAEALQTAPFP